MKIDIYESSTNPAKRVALVSGADPVAFAQGSVDADLKQLRWLKTMARFGSRGKSAIGLTKGKTTTDILDLLEKQGWSYL